MSDPSTVDRYADAIAQAMPPLSARQLDLTLSAYRAMLAGRPTEISTIAEAARWDPNEAATQLSEWPGVYFDDDKRVIGFWGLTVEPISTYLVSTQTGSSWAWCALDPLFILPLVGERGTVSARSGVTGTPVELEVTPDGVSRLAPGDEIYVSFLIPKGPFSSDVRLTFCDYVLFFDGKKSAERWTSEHPGTTALPLNDAAAIGRLQAERLRQGGSSQAA